MHVDILLRCISERQGSKCSSFDHHDRAQAKSPLFGAEVDVNNPETYALLRNVNRDDCQCSFQLRLLARILCVLFRGESFNTSPWAARLHTPTSKDTYK